MTTYWDINENDVYIKVFGRIFDEINVEFLDTNVINSFRSLHLESQYIVTRLYYRSWKFVPRSDLIKYLPEEKLQERINELIDKNWLTIPSNPEEVLEAASLKQSLELAAQFGIKSIKKHEIRDMLLSKCKIKPFFGQKSLTDRLVHLFTKSHSYYKLSEFVTELQKAMFLYLLPSYGSTNDVIVRKHMRLLTFMDYEYYPQKERPLFDSREQFESYYEARSLILDPLEEATTISDETLTLIQLAPRSGTGRYSSAYVVGRAIHLAARLIAKRKDFVLEYQWTKNYLEQNIHRGKRAENWIRLLLLELKFFDNQKDSVWLRRALNTYYDAIEDMDESSLIDLERKGKRLSSLMIKNKIDFPGFIFSEKINIPIRDETAQLNKSIKGRTSWGTENLTVEETALEIYAQEGWEGGHYENGIMSTFFMLLFHDILFSHRESFLNEVQRAPMSMQRALDANKEAIKSRLQGNITEFVTCSYETFQESQPQIAGVNWDIPLDCLVAVSKQPSCLQLIKRLVNRYRVSGFTDLTLWKDDKIKFVEVKSTNDVVSDTQYIWMKTLLENGIDVEICKICDLNNTKKRQRSEIDCVAK